jgi:2-dehydropantoate 2-reductase
LKVGVMGAGAIGSYVGGVLASAGMDLVLVGRPRAKGEFEGSGLNLSDLNGRVLSVSKTRITFATTASALGQCEVVLCCVKSAQTAAAAAEMKGVLAPDVVVVSLQNGVRNPEVLRNALPGRTVLAGIVEFNVVAQGGGAFRRTTSGALLIEATSDARMRVLGDALSQAGIAVKQVVDVRRYQWAKLVVNLNNAIGALSDVPTQELVLSKGYRKILAGTMDEALRVLRVAGIRPGRLGPLPVTLFPYLLRLPTPVLKLAAGAQVKIDPQARSSMWQDLAKGRPTEVDDLNGEIVRLAETHASAGATAPLNRRMVEIVHEAEKRGEGSPKLSAEELWAKLTGEH